MKPLSDKQCLKSEELNLVFPNLNEILDIHNKFNSAMKSKRKEEPIVGEVGDILIYMVSTRKRYLSFVIEFLYFSLMEQ